jgi:hypothetical protein
MVRGDGVDAHVIRFAAVQGSAGSRRTAFAIETLLGLLLLTATTALACSCGTPTAEGLMSSAAAVFTGVATDSVSATYGQTVTTFKVIEGFKGALAGQSIRIRHGSGASASCGVKFKSGETHTVAAYKEQIGTTLFTSLCSVWIFRFPAGEEVIQRMRLINQ